jgi:hypothetical protein
MVSAIVRRGLVAGPVLALSAVLAARQAPQSQTGLTPNTPKPTGFVLGTVVDATTGAVIAGAGVSIRFYGPVTDAVTVSGSFPQPRTDAPRQVITDAQGRFVLRELPGGRYSLQVTAPGYDFGGYLQTKPGATVHFLDLEENARRGDVQIKLWKNGSVSGTVVDEAGEPAVGVVVKALERAMGGGRRRLIVSRAAVTDDRGAYRIPQLSNGEYLIGIVTTRASLPAEMADANAIAQNPNADQTLLAMLEPISPVPGLQRPIVSGARVGDLVVDLSPGRAGYTLPLPDDSGAMQVYATTFFPNAPTAAQATPILVKSGEEKSGVNLSLVLTSAVRVSGTVTGVNGPERHALVRLMPQDADEYWQESSFETATTATDATGAFMFVGVPPGRYTLKTETGVPLAGRGVSAPAADLLARRGGSPPGDNTIFWANMPISVGSSPLTGVAVTLSRGIVFSGRVVFDGSSPKPTGDQLSRINVMLQPIGPQLAMLPSLGGRATTEGLFTTVGVPAGSYYAVTAVAPPGWRLRSVEYNGRNVAAEPLTLDGADVSGVVVTFTDKQTSITGSVTDSTGAPDTAADVIVFPADSQNWKRGLLNSWTAKLTGTTKVGTYEVTGIPAGDYFVVAVNTTLTDGWQDPAFLARLQNVATRVFVAEGEKKTVALKTAVLR